MQCTSFPDDLVALQAEWLRTYRELARRPAAASTTTLRRRLITLSCAISAHPYWSCPVRTAGGPVELRRAARARGWVRAA
ncbi:MULTISPECIES: hypothetical protein [unclassified Streptomyces]|uniref:hypothetical protein n=1 Tax=unclassified Streptomyces TaxID=2593676 RepID=UPI00224D36E9|nr:MULTISPECIES: hypothetical protein [unclassified Streptomyces]MCX4631757.1 hypothetical protein [Streptomyces sp. NBC_01443]WSW47593.1 hypothetical protein OG296_33310 [Streptomyces sp. NBC_01001]